MKDKLLPLGFLLQFKLLQHYLKLCLQFLKRLFILRVSIAAAFLVCQLLYYVLHLTDPAVALSYALLNQLEIQLLSHCLPGNLSTQACNDILTLRKITINLSPLLTQLAEAASDVLYHILLLLNLFLQLLNLLLL